MKKSSVVTSYFFFFFLFNSPATARLKEKLMEDEDVKKAFLYCEKQKEISFPLDMDQCIWDQLPDDKKKNLKEILSKNENARFESLDITPDRKHKTDTAFEKLQTYLYKRLQEALYGDVQRETKRVVDHIVFIRLYKAHLGKDIIQALSSYCIETDSSCMDHKRECSYIIRKEDRVKNRERNIKRLQEFTLDQKKSDAAIYWEGCITEIQNICHSKKTGLDYSRQRACAVVEHIKAARQNLILSSEIEDAYGKIKKSVTFDSNAEAYTGRDGQKSIEELTSITSNELINTSGFKEETEKLMKEIREKCKNPDSDECTRYFPYDQKEEKDAIDEYRIRTLVVKKALENMSKDDMKQYLKEEGYEEGQIKEMLDKNEDKIKEEINNRYSEMRKQIVTGLQNEMNKSNQVNEEKALDIYQELASRQASFKQLIHYNNIVSGYLKFRSGDSSQEGRGLWLIQRELENSAYGDEKEFEERRDALLKSISNQDSQIEEENLLLDVEEINQNLLDYPSPSP